MNKIQELTAARDAAYAAWQANKCPSTEAAFKAASRELVSAKKAQEEQDHEHLQPATAEVTGLTPDGIVSRWLSIPPNGYLGESYLGTLTQHFVTTKELFGQTPNADVIANDDAAEEWPGDHEQPPENGPDDTSWADLPPPVWFMPDEEADKELEKGLGQEPDKSVPAPKVVFNE